MALGDRNFHADFLMHAIKDLDNPVLSRRIAVALDTAILFGALERAEGNTSLQDIQVMTAAYKDKVKMLKSI